MTWKAEYGVNRARGKWPASVVICWHALCRILLAGVPQQTGPPAVEIKARLPAAGGFLAIGTALHGLGCRQSHLLLVG